MEPRTSWLLCGSVKREFKLTYRPPGPDEPVSHNRCYLFTCRSTHTDIPDCKGKVCKKHTPHKVTQYKKGKDSLAAQGKRRYDRKSGSQSFAGCSMGGVQVGLYGAIRYMDAGHQMEMWPRPVQGQESGTGLDWMDLGSETRDLRRILTNSV